MKYYYFVFYYFVDGIGLGIGNVEIKLNLPITQLNDVRIIEEWLDKDTKSKYTVSNYILLRTEETQ